LVQPFMKAMKTRGADPELLRFLNHFDSDARILAKTAADLLRVSVRLTQDEAFGLCAALETSRGDYGEMEYAAGSCATLGEALEFLRRYYFVLDGSCTIDYRCVSGRVHLLFHQPREISCRSAVDFTLAMAYLAYVRWVGKEPSRYAVYFPYPEPLDLSPYGRVFSSDTELHFDANCGAVELDETDLALPLRHSDPKLHALLASHIQRHYASKCLEPSLIDTVRSLLLEELPRGSGSLNDIAKQLGIGSRTLSRRLEEDGTTFAHLLADLRGVRAIRYLLLEAYSVSKISQLLGYSEPSAFNRAFRSWFGSTPSAYRHSKRRSSVNG